MQSRDYELDIDKLKQLLASKGWTAREIVKRGIFGQRRVDQLMRGGKRIYWSRLEELAAMFGVKPEDLIKSGPIQPTGYSESTFVDVLLSDVPEDFDENSKWIFQFFRKVLSGSGTLVDFSEDFGKVKITFEIDVHALKQIFGYLRKLGKCKPMHDPREGPDESFYIVGLLWWTDEIVFANDCPYEPLRGLVVRRGQDF